MNTIFTLQNHIVFRNLRRLKVRVKKEVKISFTECILVLKIDIGFIDTPLVNVLLFLFC